MGLIESARVPTAKAPPVAAHVNAAAVFSTDANAMYWDRIDISQLHAQRLERERLEREKLARELAVRVAQARAARLKAARLKAAKAKAAKLKAAGVRAAKARARAARSKAAKIRAARLRARKAAAVHVGAGSPRAIGRRMIAARGWGSGQFSCLDRMWYHESRWRVTADNPSSSAYGIPQALPGSKMASAGPNWRTNPATQIRWGLSHIASRYGTPCGAWSFWRSHRWY